MEKVPISQLPGRLEARPLPAPSGRLTTGNLFLVVLGTAFLLASSVLWLPVALLFSFLYLYGKFCLYIVVQVIDSAARSLLDREISFHWAVLALLVPIAFFIVPPLVVLSSINGIVLAYGRAVLAPFIKDEVQPAVANGVGYVLLPLMPLVVAGYLVYLLAIEIIYGMMIRPLFLGR